MVFIEACRFSDEDKVNFMCTCCSFNLFWSLRDENHNEKEDADRKTKFHVVLHVCVDGVLGRWTICGSSGFTVECSKADKINSPKPLTT